MCGRVVASPAARCSRNQRPSAPPPPGAGRGLSCPRHRRHIRHCLLPTLGFPLGPPSLNLGSRPGCLLIPHLVSRREVTSSHSFPHICWRCSAWSRPNAQRPRTAPRAPPAPPRPARLDWEGEADKQRVLTLYTLADPAGAGGGVIGQQEVGLCAASSCRHSAPTALPVRGGRGF